MLPRLIRKTSACFVIADLGVQRLHVDRRWCRSIAAAWTENAGSSFLKLALPLRDLVRMDVEMFS